jgi:uncharacterized membrane protein
VGGAPHDFKFSIERQTGGWLWIVDIRQRIDFEVNVRAEHEITRILTMLDELHVELGMIKADKELDKMKEKIDIAEIKEDIEHGIKKEDEGKSRRPSKISTSQTR